MIEGRLQQDGCEVYYLDGLWSRVVVATFDTPERAAAWLDAWQDHAALEAERDALAAQVARVEALISDFRDAGADLQRAGGPDGTMAYYDCSRALRAALADPDPDDHPLPPDHPAWDAADAALAELAQDAEQQAAYDALDDAWVGDTDEDLPLAPMPKKKTVTLDLHLTHRGPLPPSDIGDYDVEIDPHDEDEGGAQHIPPMHWWDWPASIRIPWPMGYAKSPSTDADEDEDGA